MSDPIDNFGDKRQSGNTCSTGWKKGISGNPGGRTSIANDLKRVGAANLSLPGTTEEARHRWWAMLMPIAFAGPNNNPAGDPNWRYAAQEVGNRLLGKVKEHVEVSGGIGPAEAALLAALHMTPEDRRRRIDEIDAEDQAALEAGPPVTDDDD